MRNSLGKYGKVYRTGGDEFTAILYIGKNRLDDILSSFENAVSNWQGKLVDSISVSFGYARADEAKGLQISDVAAIADKRMYDNKAAYYKKKGVDRRGQVDAHKALCNLYTKILKINVTDDSYQIVNMDQKEQTEEMGFSDSISKWLVSFGKSGQVHPEDLDNYLRLTDKKYINDYFEQNKTSLHVFYRRKFEDEFKQVMMEMIPADDYSNDNKSLFLYVKNIDA